MLIISKYIVDLKNNSIETINIVFADLPEGSSENGTKFAKHSRKKKKKIVDFNKTVTHIAIKKISLQMKALNTI